MKDSVNNPEISGSRSADLETELLTLLSKKHRIDPEVKKVLGLIISYIQELRRFSCNDVPLLDSLSQLDKKSMNVETVWEIADALKCRLVECGGKEYLHALLNNEQARINKTETTEIKDAWTDYFSKESLTRLVERFEKDSVEESAVKDAVTRLLVLYKERSNFGRHRRARAALRSKYLTNLSYGLLVLSAGLLISLSLLADETIIAIMAAAGFAGAIGATVGSFFKLRDELTRIEDIRGFQAVVIAQLTVGFVSGMIGFLANKSGILGLGQSASIENSWALFLLFGFAAGFSEPILLNIIGKVSGLADQKQNQDNRKQKADASGK